MQVKLISYTKDIEHPDWSLLDQVAYVARVSNPAGQEQEGDVDIMTRNKKLINYLIKNSHWSPFEMVSICMEIKTTRDIARQILRHRSFSFQEFSQRYAKVSELPVYREARLQDLNNRQNSVKSDDANLEDEWKVVQSNVAIETQKAYDWAINNGIAKEQARVVLPEGMTPSTLYMSGTLRSWIHYILLREKNGTQSEHMDVALECKKVINAIFPVQLSANIIKSIPIVEEAKIKEYGYYGYTYGYTTEELQYEVELSKSQRAE